MEIVHTLQYKLQKKYTTRSIIVRGKEKDLDVVDKVIKEIDIRTKQVLIEAFIVEANSDFERATRYKTWVDIIKSWKNCWWYCWKRKSSAL